MRVVTQQIEASAIGHGERSEQAHQRRLAGAGRSNQSEELALRNTKGNTVERGARRSASLTQMIREDRGRRGIVGLTINRRRE